VPLFFDLNFNLFAKHVLVFVVSIIHFLLAAHFIVYFESHRSSVCLFVCLLFRVEITNIFGKLPFSFGF